MGRAGNFGGNEIEVACHYYTSSGGELRVDVMYALPSDPNPIFDFFYGCTSGGTKWTAEDRRFQVISRNQWAIATFYDHLAGLSAGDEVAFENVARQLLQNAEGYAHDCSLKTSE